MEFFKKEHRYIYFPVMLLLLIWGTINTTRMDAYRTAVSRYRAQLEQSRENIDRLTEQQSRVEEITRAAVEYANRNDEYIEQSVTTVGELRAQISFLEKYCLDMRDYIFTIRDNNVNN